MVIEAICTLVTGTAIFADNLFHLFSIWSRLVKFREYK